MATMSPSGTDDDRVSVAADAPDATIGFTRVDAQPDASFLIAGMDATAQWPAVQTLRTWEREHLALRAGESLLDIGSGVGDVAIAHAGIVGPSGSVSAVDPSEAMLAEGRRRAAAAGVAVDFRTGLGEALPFPDESFDACRSERALQWMTDPPGAVAEMVRVLRPGGRLVAIDTDWRTFVADLPDDSAMTSAVDAMLAMRGEPAVVGRRLLNLARDLGLEGLDVTGAAHIWTAWDPDVEQAPAGFFPLRTVVPQLVEAGVLDPDDGERFVTEVEGAARRDRLSLSLTMFAVHGRKPA